MNIHVSQIILITFLIFFFLYAFRLRSVLIDRIIFIIGTLSGIFFIIRPELTVKIAQLIGIGRGADLLFYIYIILSMFFYVNTLAGFNRNDQKLTQIIRNIAITNPIIGNSNFNGQDDKQPG